MSQVVVQVDLFPAKVTLPTGAVSAKARLTVGNDIVKVWEDSNTGPVVRFEAPVLSLEGNRGAGYAIQTESGILTATKHKGCGCGSRLKSLNPWPDMVRKAAAS